MSSILVIIVSTLLPLLSHVIRQAVSCSNIMQPYEYTIFMIVYSVSMLVHGMWIDSASIILIIIILLLFNISFISIILVHTFASRMFLFAWAFHAIPASFMWPFAYKVVNKKKRSRTVLVLWSLQGNVGDFLGCFYSIFYLPIQYNPPTYFIAIMISILLLIVLYDKHYILEHGNAESLSDNLLETNRRHKKSYIHLFITILASCCIKTLTYTSSNFLPSLHYKYLSYAIGGIVGTLFSGILADFKVARISLHISSIFVLMFNILGFYHNSIWSNDIFSALFGSFSSFSSSMLSICICTDIADYTKKHGRTTAIIDGFATIVAACIQLLMYNPENFVFIQCISSIIFCITTMILYILNRIAYCRLQ